jgi:hypothetical protein
MTIIIDGTVGANKAVVLDSAGKLPAIDGSLVTTLNATQVTTGSIATARIDTGTTTGKVLVLDGSGNMPAIAAGAMTGVSSATKSASDPTVSTNPSTGLGTKWINTTSGEIFILTDATAGANVWTSTGGTSGNVAPWAYQGTTYGYVCGGYDNSYAANDGAIEKVSFTTDGNTGGDIGNLTASRRDCAGTRSETHGYCHGGSQSPGNNVIDKLQFSTDGNMVDVGDLLGITKYSGSATDAGNGYGFCIGGTTGSVDSNIIQRYGFSSDGDSTDWADLTVLLAPAYGGQSSATHGYVAGGQQVATYTNFINKFTFASQTNATDIGNKTTTSAYHATHSSTTYGYSAGGEPSTNIIDKFSFSTDGDATDVGDLTSARGYMPGTSSTTHGYSMGGYSAANNVTIDKFSFAAGGNATDVGDMTASRSYCHAAAGFQV